MTPQDHEDYLFLRLYSIDLQTAGQTLKAMRELKEDDQITDKGRFLGPMLRDVVVTYARPFSGNRRSGNKGPLHRLPETHVPTSSRPLHEEVMRWRKQMVAHTDIDAKDPRVARFGTAEKPWFPMAFRAVSLMPRLAEIESLVAAVESSVNAKIREIEAAL